MLATRHGARSEASADRKRKGILVAPFSRFLPGGKHASGSALNDGSRQGENLEINPAMNQIPLKLFIFHDHVERRHPLRPKRQSQT